MIVTSYTVASDQTRMPVVWLSAGPGGSGPVGQVDVVLADRVVGKDVVVDVGVGLVAVHGDAGEAVALDQVARDRVVVGTGEALRSEDPDPGAVALDAVADDDVVDDGVVVHAAEGRVELAGRGIEGEIVPGQSDAAVLGVADDVVALHQVVVVRAVLVSQQDAPGVRHRLVVDDG